MFQSKTKQKKIDKGNKMEKREVNEEKITCSPKKKKSFFFWKKKYRM